MAEKKNIDKQKLEEQKAYNEYVKEVTPTHSLPKNMAKAFLTGGIICVIGQGILSYCANIGLDKDTSGSWCSLILVLLSVLLTGFNIYPKIAVFGGAGALVPITGFANAIVSPAMEFKSEGLILGLGAKLFVIAGPVLVYGISASVIYGLILFLTGGGSV